MNPVAVINVVALSESLINETDAPNICRHRQRYGLARLQPVLPAVTCSVQASMLTGAPVSDHGIVGNGWFDRTMNEVQFWKQSNALVQGDKVWDRARRRDASFTCANMFWWYNMYSTADYSVTPRPQYKADGRKIPDVYSHPADLRDELQRELGRFPLFKFWGPMASIESSAWIAAASRAVYDSHHPTLTLIYLPHLDYPLQKLGPDHADIPGHVQAIDRIVGELIDFFDQRGVTVMLLSEYGIEPVDQPIEINRILRRAGWITIRDEDGELLDAGASRAFAVADHQVAHVYVRDAADIAAVADLCLATPGVAQIIEAPHARAGDLILVAEPGAWFAYHYWLDDAKAPDFARTVDIHRKPGYDPLELFLDPTIPLIKPRIAWKLLRKKLGFRQSMDVIPLDNALVRGSHGRVDTPPHRQPIYIGPRGGDDQTIPCTAIHDLILDTVFSAVSSRA